MRYITITFEVDTCSSHPDIQEDIFRDDVHEALREAGIEATMLDKEPTDA